MNHAKNYQTKQKNTIKDFLLENKNQHFSADQILLHLNERHTPVSKATLYRTLDQLVETKEVIKCNVDGVLNYYQYLDCEQNQCAHIHFKCEVCGQVLHIHIPMIEQLDQMMQEDYHISIDTTKTVLYGICASCQKGKLI